jgi:hypothetical protein
LASFFGIALWPFTVRLLKSEAEMKGRIARRKKNCISDTTFPTMKLENENLKMLVEVKFVQ